MIPISSLTRDESIQDIHSGNNLIRIRFKSSLLQATKPGNELQLSRRKSLSQDNINHFVEKQRRISKERHCSDSDLNPEPQTQQSETDSSTCAIIHSDSDIIDNSGSVSSTGACGIGSDTSNSQSSPKAVIRHTPAAQKRKMFEKQPTLSAASMDVLETRRRERKMGIG